MVRSAEHRSRRNDNVFRQAGMRQSQCVNAFGQFHTENEAAAWVGGLSALRALHPSLAPLTALQKWGLKRDLQIATPLAKATCTTGRIQGCSHASYFFTR